MNHFLNTLTSRILLKLSRIRAVAWIGVKLRNQCNLLIGRYLGSSSNPASNGEILVINFLASRCQNFVDVGANVGDWSTAFLQKNPKSRGFLIEPSRECLEVLHSRFLDEDVEIHDCALADFEGLATFVEEANHGETSALEICYDGVSCKTQKREIHVRTLDSLFFEREFSLDFIKIDAEGADLLVLRGASQLLASNRVQFIQFEYNSNWIKNGASLYLLRRFFQNQNFSLFLIRPDGLYEFDWDLWGEFFFYANFFACKNSSLHQIVAIQRGSI